MAVTITLRMDDEVAAAARELAATEGVSQNEAITRAILARHRETAQLAAVQAINENTKRRWAGLLDRLEKA